ncbi:hypothetical protein EYF80_026334 [Liparis tanakae]|uniref:Uncharacterized protein n=1 Tax=Liparis tanakae TaxID=230148 RepID=A0A4Z2HEY9_9TELE|nr:hypothetical protein EYF80_026334 [Liparis tanakae]
MPGAFRALMMHSFLCIGGMEEPQLKVTSGFGAKYPWRRLTLVLAGGAAGQLQSIAGLLSARPTQVHAGPVPAYSYI